ncbi:flagellar hook-associated protein FlgL [Tissierella sp. Yu-01]|uniref:flagellar hook-associated protein FlgL n=1 Tax=Tissierella sp. Yu-01 TaxID=3035694 RepID=UPI00240DF837|nr:flagellar hook-associated protein FlgL [Tissierella sp. Yu-01]WFA07925.1 flagellar hook-associated protein FlgL [Tissierella sp. Yu-01]
MRITNSTLSTNYLRNLNRNLQMMQKYQNQLSSGKEVSRPSDDPLLVSKIMDLNNNILQNEQYNKNISDTLGWVQTQDGALNNVNATLNRIRDLIIKGANGSLSETDRLAIYDEVEMKIGELQDTLNTNFDGRYIFAGQKTLSKPFSINAGELTYISESGADQTISREISKGVQVELLTVGSNVTTTTGASEADNNNLGKLLNKIMQALDNPGVDTDKLGGDYLADLDKHIDNVLQVRSKIGAIDNRLQAAESRNESENLNLNTLLSKREDIDIAEKYMEYSVMKTVYLASLQTGAQILQPSLLDYIR